MGGSFVGQTICVLYYLSSQIMTALKLLTTRYIAHRTMLVPSMDNHCWQTHITILAYAHGS